LADTYVVVSAEFAQRGEIGERTSWWAVACIRG